MCMHVHVFQWEYKNKVNKNRCTTNDLILTETQFIL